jgi:hypothetical protein
MPPSDSSIDFPARATPTASCSEIRPKTPLLNGGGYRKLSDASSRTLSDAPHRPGQIGAVSLEHSRRLQHVNAKLGEILHPVMVLSGRDGRCRAGLSLNTPNRPRVLHEKLACSDRDHPTVRSQASLQREGTVQFLQEACGSPRWIRVIGWRISGLVASREHVAMPAHVSQANGMIFRIVQKMTAVWQPRLDRLRQRIGRWPAGCLRRIT